MYKKNSLALCIALIAAGSQQVFAQATAPAATSSDVEEVIVSGVREAELNAREAERIKNIFSSVIAQDDAGNFADQNVAESLQRLPGVTLQKEEGEGKFVSVRGLGPGFVAVSMNGNELASASSDTRAFALDALPADMLGSIEVFKSLTPDMDLNSIAGIVNVKTVSAFDKKKDTLKANVQGFYQDYSDEYSPKVTLQGTNLFLDKAIGLGYTLSYEDRATETYQVRHHTDNPMEYRTDNSGKSILSPNQMEARQEEADRKRITGSIDLGYRPDDQSEYFVRVNKTKFEDMDVALREYYRFDTALNNANPALNENVYIDQATGTFGIGDGELQQQYFLQKGTATTTAASIGGKNKFNDTWNLDYAYAYSKGEYSKPDGSRVQFRLQDLAMLGRAGKDYIAGQVISRDDMKQLTGAFAPFTGGKFQAGAATQGDMVYDNIFIEDSFRDDTINQFNLNLKKDFEDGSLNYIKAGIQIKNRDRDRNKDRWSIVPYDFKNGCAGDAECLDLAEAHLSDFETYKPNSPDFTYNFITRAETERLLATTTRIAKYVDPNNTDQESRKEDYLLTEDTSSAYLMAEWQLSDVASLIAGARYEQTDFTSTGYFTVRNDRGENPNTNENFDEAIALGGTEVSYNDLLPSVHLRYELSDDILIRSALWTSFTRPSFDQSRAFIEAEGRVLLCNPDPEVITNKCSDNPSTLGQVNAQGLWVSKASGNPYTLSSGNTLSFGNPTLKAMTATNFDASITWFESKDLFLQAAVFYKDISDFIVAVNGDSIALKDLPIAIPTSEVKSFVIPSDLVIENVNWSTNGEKARVYGVELSYSQYFDSGLFAQSNLTLMHSDAKVGDTIRAGSIALPEQANETFNLTLGWENDDFSVRLIGNYRSKVLKEIGSCPVGATTVTTCKTWSDIYDDATVSYDFKATYQVTKSLKVYFDALNLTDEHSLQYFSGNSDSRGNSLYVSEAWGRSYQLGMNITFF
jgi:TonB-dependent receptor